VQQQQAQQGAGSKALRIRTSLSGESSSDGASQHSQSRDAHEAFIQKRLGRILRKATVKGGKADVSVIAGAIHDEDPNDKHVEYDLSCTFVVPVHSRRYTEFKELDLALQKRLPTVKLPPLPEFSSWGFNIFSRRSFDPDHVAKKGQHLDHYLRTLAKSPSVRNCPEFLEFVLCAKDPRGEDRGVVSEKKARTVLYEVDPAEAAASHSSPAHRLQHKEREGSRILQPIRSPKTLTNELEEHLVSRAGPFPFEDESDDDEQLFTPPEVVEEFITKAVRPAQKDAALQQILDKEFAVKVVSKHSRVEYDEKEALVISFQELGVEFSFWEHQFDPDTGAILAKTRLNGFPLLALGNLDEQEDRKLGGKLQINLS